MLLVENIHVIEKWFEHCCVDFHSIMRHLDFRYGERNDNICDCGIIGIRWNDGTPRENI